MATYLPHTQSQHTQDEKIQGIPNMITELIVKIMFKRIYEPTIPAAVELIQESIDTIFKSGEAELEILDHSGTEQEFKGYMYIESIMRTNGKQNDEKIDIIAAKAFLHSDCENAKQAAERYCASARQVSSSTRKLFSVYPIPWKNDPS